MDNALFRSPISRIIAGGADILSAVLFVGVWVANLVTAGFSLAGTQTFAGWTYFPIFWPHLLAATLGILIFLRYGANFATAVTTVLLWLVAWVSDLYGAIAYWHLFWLCNAGPKSQLSGVGREICDSENALLISLMVLGTLLWFISFAGVIAHAFDLFQAGRSGSSKPGRVISAPILWIGFANILTLVAFFALWLANWISTSISLGGGQTYAVWAYINIFLVQLSASVVGTMLFLRYGSNWVTAAAAIILWATSFFAGFYGTALYWRLGWFCTQTSASTLSGNQLVICTEERSYLIALWVLTSALWILSIIAPIAHALDFFAAGSHDSARVKLGGTTSADDAGVAPNDDIGDATNSKDPNEGGDDNGVSPMDQYGTYNDGSSFVSGTAIPAVTHGIRGLRSQLPYYPQRPTSNRSRRSSSNNDNINPAARTLNRRTINGNSPTLV